MSGGGSKKGRKLSQYRRSNFWPRDPVEKFLDAAINAMPAPSAMRAVAKLCGVRTNVRAKLATHYGARNVA